ncbi:hypothetical protein MBRA1_002715 [Malassezia brasiliensis]|uniref:[Histone H3]-trimethyl-L-lysine(9) demethylase n=1 Tax=Malassezia brasiliensis TaxID=1821822 RepID=A0AAF0IPC1_9BASI|nr:hypothetical protein MBRA1_002715 [Malassezia brasiliensis]
MTDARTAPPAVPHAAPPPPKEEAPGVPETPRDAPPRPRGSALDDIQPAYFYPVDAYTAEHASADASGSEDEERADHVQGVPVFTPTMEQFSDFYAFCQAIDAWGMRSGIVKVVPPREWVDALPDLGARASTAPGAARVDRVRIKNAITQHFLAAGPGRWKQTNVTRAKQWDAKQWADLCADAKQRGPPMRRVRAKAEAAIAAEHATAQSRRYTPPTEPVVSVARPPRASAVARRAPVRAPKAHATTAAEWDAFDYRRGWTHEAQADDDAAPPAPSAWDAPVCRAIEAEYWRSLNFGKPPMYGADLQGTLFDARTTSWNVGTLDSLLSRRLQHALPGVTTPYLYFGMWRASFAWHVEDMDLYSINYLHFGAPKQWYAIRQADRQRFESVMASAFPDDSRKCPHFMRHKSFLASPTFLASQGIRPLRLVQHAHEFVLTYPYGYHAGFNLGFNCAESVNFALPSWIDIGLKADYCKCPLAQESVHFDLAAFLDEAAPPAKRARTEKRSPPHEAPHEARPSPAYDCVFCVSPRDAHMLAIPRAARDAAARAPAAKKALDAAQRPGPAWEAHQLCAAFIPETWPSEHGVEGAGDIERARWQLKCSLCADAEAARHGAKVQCTKGKCPRAVHVGCALEEGSGWLLDVVSEAEAAQLEGRAGGPRRAPPADTAPTPEAPLADAAPTPEAAADAAATTPPADRLVVLCRTHNPRRQREEAARRDAQLAAAVAALPLGTPVRVKTGSGVWTSCLRAVDAAERVVLVDEEPEVPGTATVRVPWTKLQLDDARAPARGALAPHRSDAYVLECKVPVRRTDMKDTLHSDTRAQTA